MSKKISEINNQMTKFELLIKLLEVKMKKQNETCQALQKACNVKNNVKGENK